MIRYMEKKSDLLYVTNTRGIYVEIEKLFE